MPYRFITLAAVAASLGASACGDRPDAPARTQDRGIERTVQTWMTAVAEGDAPAACKVLGPVARKQFVDRASFSVGALLGRGTSCDGAVAAVHEDLAWEEQEALRTARVHELRFTAADVAEVADEDVITGAAYAGFGVNGRPLVLQRDGDGRWKITELG